MHILFVVWVILQIKKIIVDLYIRNNLTIGDKNDRTTRSI